jgi:hydroxyacylglutathione hydrolase
MYIITPIPAFNDNYIWLITRTDQPYGVIVDPGDATPVIAVLQKTNIIPIALLITHHHWDHSGGIPALTAQYAMQVYGSEQATTQGLTMLVNDGETIDLPNMGLSFEVISIPGHTLDHLAYYGHGMLFCGDTLFSAGCGRLFEGTAAQMYQSLSRLAQLPEDTKIYCGHEYTLANLRFAQTVEPENPMIIEHIKTASALRSQSLPTLPSTIGVEKQINPFLRCQESVVIAAAEKKAGHTLTSPVDVFQTLRGWKDNY